VRCLRAPKPRAGSGVVSLFLLQCTKTRVSSSTAVPVDRLSGSLNTTREANKATMNRRTVVNWRTKSFPVDHCLQSPNPPPLKSSRSDIKLWPRPSSLHPFRDLSSRWAFETLELSDLEVGRGGQHISNHQYYASCQMIVFPNPILWFISSVDRYHCTKQPGSGQLSSRRSIPRQFWWPHSELRYPPVTLVFLTITVPDHCQTSLLQCSWTLHFRRVHENIKDCGNGVLMPLIKPEDERLDFSQQPHKDFEFGHPLSWRLRCIQ